MNRNLLVLLLALGFGRALFAQETNTAERLDLRSFRIISERNIFDPNRSSRADRASRREREPERRVRNESISLVGTMSYDKGWFAFFDGSSAEYRKALQPNDAIAGYTISQIAPNYVKLESTNSPPLELKVGMQIKKQDEGEWELSRPAGFSPSETSASASGTNASAAASDDDSDIIKRLMQKREQELQK